MLEPDSSKIAELYCKDNFRTPFLQNNSDLKTEGVNIGHQ